MAYDKKKWATLRRETAAALLEKLDGETLRGLAGFGLERLAQEICASSEAKAAAVKADKIVRLTANRAEAKAQAWVIGGRVTSSTKAGLLAVAFDAASNGGLDAADRDALVTACRVGTIEALGACLKRLELI